MNFKQKGLAVFCMWGVFLATGSLASLNDNRVYATGTFLVSVVLMLFSKKIGKWVRSKLNTAEDDRG